MGGGGESVILPRLLRTGELLCFSFSNHLKQKTNVKIILIYQHLVSHEETQINIKKCKENSSRLFLKFCNLYDSTVKNLKDFVGI